MLLTSFRVRICGLQHYENVHMANWDTFGPQPDWGLSSSGNHPKDPMKNYPDAPKAKKLFQR